MTRNDIIRFVFVIGILISLLVYPILGIEADAQILGAFSTILGYYFGLQTTSVGNDGN